MQLSISKKIAVDQSSHPATRSSLKRLMDVIGALTGLAFTLVLFCPIAILIKLDSQGAVLYSQYRCGLNGQLFRIWKFRSMVSDAESLKTTVENEASGHIFKSKNDPRITRVGRFLRKTSLDELPQFWNVLQGDMSLVGTRPPTPDEVNAYSEHHFTRLRVKPGITGEWQVHGRSSVKDFDDIVNMDLRYQSKWSVMYDLKLLFKTILVVLSNQGAY